MAYPLVKDRAGRLARVIGRSPKGFIRCAMCDKTGRANGRFGYYLFAELRPASIRKSRAK